MKLDSEDAFPAATPCPTTWRTEEQIQVREMDRYLDRSKAIFSVATNHSCTTINIAEDSKDDSSITPMTWKVRKTF